MSLDDPTEEWLRAANERYRQRQLPPKGRPFEALSELSQERNASIRMDSPVAERIFAWFVAHTQPGSHAMGALFTGAFHYDACFWPVTIPIAYGTCRFVPLDALETMSAPIKTSLAQDRTAFTVYLTYWVNCFDYALGFDEILKGSRVTGLARSFLENADRELNGAIYQLLPLRPNLKVILGFRLACEIFLKTFLIAEMNLTEKELKKLSHRLADIAKECFAAKPLQEFQILQNSVHIFPEVSDRYDGPERSPREVFDSCFIAQLTAVTVTRHFSGRDSRPRFRAHQ